jgi:hypothetical protein
MKRALILLTYLLMMNEAFASCDLYKPYRCVPVYGNQIKCGCGL